MDRRRDTHVSSMASSTHPPPTVSSEHAIPNYQPQPILSQIPSVILNATNSFNGQYTNNSNACLQGLNQSTYVAPTPVINTPSPLSGEVTPQKFLFNLEEYFQLPPEMERKALLSQYFSSLASTTSSVKASSVTATTSRRLSKGSIPHQTTLSPLFKSSIVNDIIPTPSSVIPAPLNVKSQSRGATPIHNTNTSIYYQMVGSPVSATQLSGPLGESYRSPYGTSNRKVNQVSVTSSWSSAPLFPDQSFTSISNIPENSIQDIFAATDIYEPRFNQPSQIYSNVLSVSPNISRDGVPHSQNNNINSSKSTPNTKQFQKPAISTTLPIGAGGIRKPNTKSNAPENFYKLKNYVVRTESLTNNMKRASAMTLGMAQHSSTAEKFRNYNVIPYMIPAVNAPQNDPMKGNKLPSITSILPANPPLSQTSTKNVSQNSSSLTTKASLSGSGADRHRLARATTSPSSPYNRTAKILQTNIYKDTVTPLTGTVVNDLLNGNYVPRATEMFESRPTAPVRQASVTEKKIYSPSSFQTKSPKSGSGADRHTIRNTYSPYSRDSKASMNSVPPAREKFDSPVNTLEKPSSTTPVPNLLIPSQKQSPAEFSANITSSASRTPSSSIASFSDRFRPKTSDTTVNTSCRTPSAVNQSPLDFPGRNGVVSSSLTDTSVPSSEEDEVTEILISSGTTAAPHEPAKEKRVKPLTQAFEISDMDTCEKFHAALHSYLEERGHNHRKSHMPRSNGYIIDLYTLFKAVIKFGGSEKLPRIKPWHSVLRGVCQISSDDLQHIAKQITLTWHRYLDDLEKEFIALGNKFPFGFDFEDPSGEFKVSNVPSKSVITSSSLDTKYKSTSANIKPPQPAHMPNQHQHYIQQNRPSFTAKPQPMQPFDNHFTYSEESSSEPELFGGVLPQSIFANNDAGIPVRILPAERLPALDTSNMNLDLDFLLEDF